MEVAPLPKSQNQEVGFPVEPSVKPTTSGEHPETRLAENAACGAWAWATKNRHTPSSVRMMGLRIKSLNLLVWVTIWSGG